MALTNAERQARYRQRQKEALAFYKNENIRLKKKVKRLLKEIRDLRGEASP